MKIVLLNLPVDNNYGGMLQRYALVKVLQDMGHEVVHLNMRFPINVGSPMQKADRFIKRVIKRVQGRYKGSIRAEYWAKKHYDNSCKVTDTFYNKYIRHTSYITTKAKLAEKCRNADVLVVGSDQIWRKAFVGHFGIGTYFGDFLPEKLSLKLIVYGASFGIVEDSLTNRDKEYLAPLYRRFSSVSVREDSGLQLLNDYGWNCPKAEQVLDPTFLLSRDDYSQLIDASDTIPLDGDMACYILDRTDEKAKVISGLAESKGMRPYYLPSNGVISVEQWLRSFRDAEYIVTDSYHGLVFSIIMKKPVYLFMNQRRGNARFDSLLKICGINDVGDYYEGSASVRDFVDCRNKSVDFLRRSLDEV